MSKTPQHTWTFPSKGLKAIFDHEIRGQLSDGAWENSLPYNHWYFWSHVKTEADNHWRFEFNDKVDFQYKYPKKKSAYNLTTLLDPKLVDLSGRMRAYYIDGEYGYGLGREVDYLVGKNDEILSKEAVIAILKDYKNDYFNPIIAKFEKFDRYEVFAHLYIGYTKELLTQDLRIIKRQMKDIIQHCN